MSIFDFLTGSRKKVNLTPEFDYPVQENLWFTGGPASQGGYSLRDFAAKRIKGENLGFGPDFVDKAANPAIAQRENAFQKKTVPFLSSQLSSRGLARSAGSGLATDVLGQAEQQKNLDVNELVSKFYTLNKMQEKTDQSEALGLAQNLDNQQAGLLSQRAQASERQVGRNIDERNYRADADASAGKTLVSAALGAISGGMNPGAGMSALQGMVSGGFMGLSGQQANAMSPQDLFALWSGQSAHKVNVLGSYEGATNPKVRAPLDYYKYA